MQYALVGAASPLCSAIPSSLRVEFSPQLNRAMNWSLLFAQIVLSGTTLSLVAWLSKTLVSQQLSKDLEAFKRQLAIEADRDRVRFSKLHERRAEIIEEVYRRAHDILGMLRLQSTNPADAKGTSEHLTTELVEIVHYFGRHALYFSDDVKRKFQAIFVIGLAKPMLALYGIGELQDFERRMKERNRDISDIRLTQPFVDSLKEQIPALDQLMRELENEFQTLLGVTK
ncbi:MAG: hypothetical protein Q7S40_15470 [Opitutaceae bacterium]|nr:hypothetical protein [Opitutaceae bacterium]